MGNEAMTEIAKVLGNFEPRWVLAIVVGAILSYRSPRSPQLVKELFAGIRGLLAARTNSTPKRRTASEPAE